MGGCVDGALPLRERLLGELGAFAHIVHDATYMVIYHVSFFLVVGMPHARRQRRKSGARLCFSNSCSKQRRMAVPQAFVTPKVASAD